MYSVSKIECFKECKRKYKHRYIDKLEEEKNWYLEFGTKFHEAISKGESDDPDIDKMVKILYKDKTFSKYKDKIKEFEKKIFYDYAGDRFISILDAVGDNFILEFKSSKDFWTEEKFDKELQSHLYIQAKKLTTGKKKKFIYFIVTRPLKGKDPEVQSKEIKLNKKRLEEIVNLVKEIERETVFDKNYNRYCWFCSFYKLCNQSNQK